MNKDLENLLDECNVIEYKQEVSEGLFKSISAFSNTDLSITVWLEYASSYKHSYMIFVPFCDINV